MFCTHVCQLCSSNGQIWRITIAAQFASIGAAFGCQQLFVKRVLPHVGAEGWHDGATHMPSTAQSPTATTNNEMDASCARLADELRHQVLRRLVQSAWKETRTRGHDGAVGATRPTESFN